MLKIALAQINVTVGDLAGNSRRIMEYIERARHKDVSIVVFPELALCGYPPEDLLLKEHMVDNNLQALKALAAQIRQEAVIVGFVDKDSKGRIYNAAALIQDGKIRNVYHKCELPNYGVFDEKRYFTPGVIKDNKGLVTIGKLKVGISICEDIWIDGSVCQQQAAAGAELLINLSSSPYEAGKLKTRQALLSGKARQMKRPVLYANLVGGQDELVFDGASMAFDAEGKLIARAQQFTEELLVVDPRSASNSIANVLDETAEIYGALVLGTKDYVHKNGFTRVGLGLSGGIDSALVAVIAVDALGADNVSAISMPSKFNARSTKDDAKTIARNLGIEFKEIPIKAMHEAYLKTLKKYFKGTPVNIAEENLQARIRGNILMAFSNKFGWLILTTGNKSEMAVGYCTLYGDMSGGFAPLKDIFKTQVYALMRWRNRQGKAAPVPRSVILRAPTAELRAGQRDEQSLGAYEDLDRVLSGYVHEHHSLADSVKTGLDAAYVAKTMRMVDRNEYKRRQAPPGVKISPRAFGRDWRLPITNKYKE